MFMPSIVDYYYPRPSYISLKGNIIQYLTTFDDRIRFVITTVSYAYNLSTDINLVDRAWILLGDYIYSNRPSCTENHVYNGCHEVALQTNILVNDENQGAITDFQL